MAGLGRRRPDLAPEPTVTCTEEPSEPDTGRAPAGTSSCLSSSSSPQQLGFYSPGSAHCSKTPGFIPPPRRLKTSRGAGLL